MHFAVKLIFIDDDGKSIVERLKRVALGNWSLFETNTWAAEDDKEVAKYNDGQNDQTCKIDSAGDQNESSNR